MKSSSPTPASSRNPTNHRRRWLLLAPLGLAVIGFGVCLVAEAAMLKFTGEAWFWPGTGALIVLNTGVCLVGGAVREEVLWRLSEQQPHQATGKA